MMYSFFIIVACVTLLSASNDCAAAKGYVNTIGMEFVSVPAGSFFMGAQDIEDGSSKEHPRHLVTLSRSFYLARYEVTQEQWLAVMGDVNPSNFIFANASPWMKYHGRTYSFLFRN